MRLILLTLTVALSAPVLAYPDPDLAPLPPERPCLAGYDRAFLFDYLGVFGPDFARAIEIDGCAVYRATSAHFVLVTVPDTEGESLENYALHLFERWGIGDADRLDGVLLLYVANYLDGGGAVRIEVGYGLEAVLSSAVTRDAYALMVAAREEMRAYNASEGQALEFALAVGAEALLSTVADGYQEGGFPDPERPAGPSVLALALILGAFLLLVLVLAATAGRGGGSWGYTSHPQAWTGPSTRVFVGTVALEALRIGLGAAGGGGFGGGRSGGGGKSGRF